MSLEIGIIGMPNVGKSTLFNALTRAGAAASAYPFCTVEPNVGVVELPDETLVQLNGALSPKECTPASVRFVDIAGLVRGASRGEGLGNKFLSHIREVNAIVHLIRCFEDDLVSHVDGTVDPVRDLEIVDLELILADLAAVSKARKKIESLVKRGAPEANRVDLEILKKAAAALDAGTPLRKTEIADMRPDCLSDLGLLTTKPVLVLGNVSEDDASVGGPVFQQLAERVGSEDVIPVSAKIEAEIAELPEEERTEFLEAVDLQESGLVRLVKACHSMLGLIRFYTIANEKLRAWSVPGGTTAVEAAGEIHSDMARGFIRAEVVEASGLLDHGSFAALHKLGLVRTEGRDYVVQDRDVIQILFNV